jgi:hypothetical protein
MKRKKRRFRRQRWMLVPALGALIVGGFALNTSSGDSSPGWFAKKLRGPRFHLKVVEFLGLEKLEAAALHDRMGLTQSLPLIDLDVDEVAAKVCAHPRIANCIAARIPPDRLVFEIEERMPVARLAGRDAGMDLEGAVFPLVAGEAKTLTELRGNPQWALPLLRAAQAHEMRFSMVEARSAEDVRFQPMGQSVQVRVGAEPDLSLADWLQLSGSDLVRGYAAREVDLRFQGSAVLSDFRKTAGGVKDGPQ